MRRGGAVSAGAVAWCAGATALAASDSGATALAASGELGDELLQKVNGNFKAWHGNKLTH